MKKLFAYIFIAALMLSCLTACDLFKKDNGVTCQEYENCAVFTFDDFPIGETTSFEITRTGLGEGAIYYQINLEKGALSISYKDTGFIHSVQPLGEFTADDEMPMNGSGGYIEGGKITITFEPVSTVSGEIIIAFTETALKAVHKDILLHKHTFEYEIREDAHKKIYTCECTNLEKRDFELHYDENTDGKCDECEYYVGIPHEDHNCGYDVNETSHRQIFGCGCESAENYEAHYNNDGDNFCDACGYDMHEHTYETYQDEFGHGWAYTCICDTPPNFAPHFDGNGDKKCDACGYIMNQSEADTGKVQTTIGEEATLPQFMSLEADKHNALSNGSGINIDVYMGYKVLNKDGAVFSDIIVPESDFAKYTFVLEINYNNEIRVVALDSVNYFEEYICDMYQDVVQYSKYDTIQLDTETMSEKSYGFVNVELSMISDTNQRYWVSAQTLYYSVTDTEIVFGLVSNPVANEGDPGIITKGWEYSEN